MPNRPYRIRGLRRAAGLIKASSITLRRLLGVGGTVTVKINGCAIGVRACDSDPLVLAQIFGLGEYALDPGRLAALQAAASDWLANGIKPVIIDAGANVGYSALYFASLFPRALVLAIEPDEASYAMLERHAEANPAIIPVHAALWSHDRGLRLQTSSSGSWGSHVVEGAGIPSQRIDRLIASVPNGRPLIIKLDIEGAEREVVASAPGVFSEAQAIVVEPHDYLDHGASCLSPLYRIAADRCFDTIIRGENLFLFSAMTRK